MGERKGMVSEHTCQITDATEMDKYKQYHLFLTESNAYKTYFMHFWADEKLLRTS